MRVVKGEILSDDLSKPDLKVGWQYNANLLLVNSLLQHLLSTLFLFDIKGFVLRMQGLRDGRPLECSDDVTAPSAQLHGADELGRLHCADCMRRQDAILCARDSVLDRRQERAARARSRTVFFRCCRVEEQGVVGRYGARGGRCVRME